MRASSFSITTVTRRSQVTASSPQRRSPWSAIFSYLATRDSPPHWSATLTPASDRQLTALAAVLCAYADVSVDEAGYTDNTGDAAANRKLSADRAAAVKQALVARGVPASRIADEGFWPDSPIAPNDTEEGRSRNRRVELAVVKR